MLFCKILVFKSLGHLPYYVPQGRHVFWMILNREIFKNPLICFKTYKTLNLAEKPISAYIIIKRLLFLANYCMDGRTDI